MKCKGCDNLLETEIKVIDVRYSSPFMEDLYHFEKGFKCTWSGLESLDIAELPKHNCRCIE